jgi:hypothetical protein
MNESHENTQNTITELDKKMTDQLELVKEEQIQINEKSNLLFEKQTSNENLTKELNASLLDLLKEEIDQIKDTLLSYSSEIEKLSENKSDDEVILQNLQALENKLKKFPLKKKIDSKFDMMIESLKKDIEEVNSNFHKNLTQLKNQLINKVKVKMDKKDLNHFLIKKVDTDNFNTQISIISDSMLGMKKKVGILQTELRNFPKQQISEVKLIGKLEKKIKKNYLTEFQTDFENKLNHVTNHVEEINKNQIDSKRTLESQLKIKADREVIQKLLIEQAKINEFICAENVVARFKVRIDIILIVKEYES